MNETDQLFVEALSLPSGSRASLTRRLLESLETDAASPEVEAAWKTEALERCRAFDAGELRERPAADVLVDVTGKRR